MSNQLPSRYVNICSRPGALGVGASTICGSGRKKIEEFSAMKKLLAICMVLSIMFLLVAVVAAEDMGKATTVNGFVSDSKCGAKGANAGAAACTKKCLEAGASAVVVTDGDNKVLAVDNADALKGHEGHHVAVTGHVKGDSIHVESVKML
jgi:hypothetical protein